MTAPLRPDKASTAATRFSRRLTALVRADVKRLGLKGQNARKARDELVAVAVNQITARLAGSKA